MHDEHQPLPHNTSAKEFRATCQCHFGHRVVRTEKVVETVDREPSQETAPNRPARSAPLSAKGLLKDWGPLLLFALLWADLIRLLSYQWEAREQYSYGWLVPFFAAALFWKRWPDRPAPDQRGISLWAHVLAAAAALLLLPSRVVYEINPDWPLVGWVHTACVIAVTYYLLLQAGGWSWLRHFGFPVAFILVAVVWPYRIEKGITQGLMQVVAGLTVELLGWFDIAAVQRGNLIEISTGVLGVDEACSGIRSFQSSIMAGLFMGELYRMRFWARGILLVVGALLAFCFNVTRTFWLSYQANAEGLQAVDKYHDGAGLTILLSCFAALWGMSLLIRRISRTPEAAPDIGGSSLSKANPGWYSTCATLGCWVIVCLIATEGWYRSHEVANPGYFHWSTSLPSDKPTFREIELSSRTIQMLAYSEASMGKWLENDGSDWTLFFFRWNPTSIKNVIGARIHRPDVCLPASGMRLVDDAGLEYLEAAGLSLPFRKYVYDHEGRLYFVFFCQWEDGSEKQLGLWGDSNRAGERFRAVLTGRRNLGQQTLQIIVSGPENLQTALERLRSNLPNLIRSQ